MYLMTFVLLASSSAGQNVLISRTDSLCFHGVVHDRCPPEVDALRGTIVPERLRGEGPLVELIGPKESPVYSPTTLQVRFIERDSPIDLSSLRLTARKWIGITRSYSPARNITQRVLQFTGPSGIAWPRAEVDSGRYIFELRIQDQKARVTEYRFAVEVH